MFGEVGSLLDKLLLQVIHVRHGIHMEVLIIDENDDDIRSGCRRVRGQGG